LYIGRIDEGKGCAELIRSFKVFKKMYHQPVTLVLMGRTHMPSINTQDIRFLGFLPDAYIKPAIESCSIVVVPSRYESLSILLLQGFMCGKPAIVNGDSPVLKDHCIESNAGLFYRSEDEFLYSLKLLLCRSDLRAFLGNNGKKYIQSQFTWPIVTQKFRNFIDSL